ncbi:hypothetical protein J7H08_000492 [Salmonella enterica]|nr:hypothetical protein [Salmonella enterica]
MINDVKWVQAQRHASDWRHALDIAVRPLITFGAAAPFRTIQRISQWLDSPESVAMLQDAPNDAALFAQLTALR